METQENQQNSVAYETVEPYPSRPNPRGLSWAAEEVVGAQGLRERVKNFAVYAPGLDRVDVIFTGPHYPQDRAPELHELTRVPLPASSGGVHHGVLTELHDGALYALIDGNTPEGEELDGMVLLDPYARAVTERMLTNDDEDTDTEAEDTEAEESVGWFPTRWWSIVVEDEWFDWGDSSRPLVPMRDTVIYEAHVIGQTKLHPEIPEHLRGTYAGLAHPVSIAHLKNLGVTSVELLPVHHHTSEGHLKDKGLTNYWGYNTVNYFSPQPSYATQDAQKAGPKAVADEFKGMVRLLHEAGLEVIIDVVYNHTAEEGQGGPVFCWRGLGEGEYYRWTPDGEHYDDTTGTGNALDFSNPQVTRMALDSLRTWVLDYGVDGFRFDLAVTLARDETNTFTPHHPLLVAINSDPVLSEIKMITEPWDVGMGGWRTGQFPAGFHDWNDHYRDTMRDFWVADRGALEGGGQPKTTLGRFADVFAGSQGLFADSQRDALASVNFITAHDGFTLADLVSYNRKHNEANGEDNRDGTENNRSYNHGVEGETTERVVNKSRYRTQRNLLATLALSMGVPMITAGDEMGRSQQGNNNAYCQNSELSWFDWPSLLREGESNPMFTTTRRLLKLRRNFLQDQPYTYPLRDSGTLLWFNADGRFMSQEEWESPQVRTMQILMGTPGARTTGLVVINGGLWEETIRLPDEAPGNEDLLGGLSGHPFTLEITTNRDQMASRRGNRLWPGQTDKISPFSVTIYSVTVDEENPLVADD